MTFLFPTVLWGLAAASIPIIIHLLSLRHTRDIEFSTLYFIKELEHKTIRRLKLRQLLLVLIRVLVIVCLILMVARPVDVLVFVGVLVCVGVLVRVGVTALVGV